MVSPAAVVPSCTRVPPLSLSFHSPPPRCWCGLPCGGGGGLPFGVKAVIRGSARQRFGRRRRAQQSVAGAVCSAAVIRQLLEVHVVNFFKDQVWEMVDAEWMECLGGARGELAHAALRMCSGMDTQPALLEHRPSSLRDFIITARVILPKVYLLSINSLDGEVSLRTLPYRNLICMPSLLHFKCITQWVYMIFMYFLNVALIRHIIRGFFSRNM
ncbi:hypothetical protein ABZP36_026455 [Zizania latifolia]